MRFSRLLPIAGVIALVVIAAWTSHRQRPADAAADIVFDRGTLGVSIGTPTSLTFGPDGRLYVASQTQIQALTLNERGDAIVSNEQIASDLSGVLGIAFDPIAGASPMTLYASGQDATGPVGYQGIVSKFVAPGWAREDVITGLPTSAGTNNNHFTNGLAFDAEGRLLIAQGSTTDSGIADPPGNASYWHESPLSAAILIADVRAAGFDGRITYSSGPPNNDNIDQTGGDVRVFASGTRNSYDVLVHSNGHIYATDNGPLGMGTSLDCTTAGGTTSVADELNLIEEGNYYGAPNRNRGRTDPRQCVYRSPLDGSGADFTGPIAILPGHCSCDGIAEYTVNSFGGKLLGGIVMAQFIRDEVVVQRLAPDGRSVISTEELGDDFEAPLDVAVSATGAVYVAEFGGNTVSFLIPEGTTPAPTTAVTPSATPTRTRTPTPTMTPASTRGDVDCSGGVDSIDAALILQLSAGLIGSLPCPVGADVDDNGAVNSVDAALVLQYTAGLLKSLD